MAVRVGARPHEGCLVAHPWLVLFTPNRRVTFGAEGNTKRTAFPNTPCSRSNSSATAGACQGLVIVARSPLPPESLSTWHGLYLKQGVRPHPLPCSL